MVERVNDSDEKNCWIKIKIKKSPHMGCAGICIVSNRFKYFELVSTYWTIDDIYALLHSLNFELVVS